MFLLMLNSTIAVLCWLIFRAPFYSPFDYHVQGLMHNLRDSMHKFAFDYYNNVDSIAKGIEA